MKKLLWLLLFLFVLFFTVFPITEPCPEEQDPGKRVYGIDFSNQFVYSFNVFNSGKGVQP